MAVEPTTASSLNKNVDYSSLREVYAIIRDQSPSRDELFEILKPKEDSSGELIGECADFLILIDLVEEDEDLKAKIKDSFNKAFLEALNSSDTVFAEIFKNLIESGRYTVGENEFEAFLREEFSNAFKTSSSLDVKIGNWKKVMKGFLAIEKENNEIVFRYKPELILEILSEDISIDKDLGETLRRLDKITPCLTSTGELHKAAQDALVHLDNRNHIVLSKEEDLGGGFEITVKPDYGSRNAIEL